MFRTIKDKRTLKKNSKFEIIIVSANGQVPSRTSTGKVILECGSLWSTKKGLILRCSLPAPQWKSILYATSQTASSWGQHVAHLGPGGPRWAPCWPHKPCYQGYCLDETWISPILLNSSEFTLKKTKVFRTNGLELIYSDGMVLYEPRVSSSSSLKMLQVTIILEDKKLAILH